MNRFEVTAPQTQETDQSPTKPVLVNTPGPAGAPLELTVDPDTLYLVNKG